MVEMVRGARTWDERLSKAIYPSKGIVGTGTQRRQNETRSGKAHEDVFPVPLRLVSHRLTSSQPLGVQNIYLYIYCIRTQYINRGERKGEGRMLK